MAESLGVAVLELEADTTKADRQLETFRSSMTQKVGALGAGLTATLTPVAAGIAILGKQAFDQWDTAIDGIRANTGKTGKDLEALGDVVKRVGATSNQPLSQIGDTVAQLNQRLGATGQPLETLTRQFSNLQHLGIDASVETVTRVFGDWSVKTKDQSEALDGLFRASQVTGSSVESLGSLMVRFGAPMRQFGFSIDEAAALLGSFEKNGVNTELVMGSLRIAMGKFAKAGVPMKEGLTDVIDRIQKLGPGAESTALAMETFGARAGPDMAAAILEGRFEIDGLLDTLSNSHDTINKAAEDTFDLGDKLSMLKNRVVGAVGPYGELIAMIGGGLAAVGPAMMGFSALGPAIGALVSPAGLVVAAVAALVAGFVVAYQKSETFREIVGKVVDFLRDTFAPVFEFVKETALGVWESIKGSTDEMKGTLESAMGAIRAIFDATWPYVKTVVENAWNTIKTVVQAAIEVVGGIIKTVMALIRGDWSAAWDGIKQIFSGIWDGIKGIVRGALENLKTVLSAAWGVIKTVAGAAWDGIKSLLSSAWDGIKELVQRGIDAVVEFVRGMGDRIAGLASGFVTKAKEIGQGIWDGIKQGIGDLARKLGEVFSALVGFATGLAGKVGGWFAGIGSAIVDGIKSGITGAWDSFTSWLGGKLGGLKDSILGFFGIGSPSKLMADEVGAPIMQGIAVGIENASGELQARAVGAIQRVGAAVKSEAAAWMDLRALGGSGPQIDYLGLRIPGFARGGRITAGSGQGDDVLALLARNEAVVTPAQISRLGGPGAFARAGVPGFQDGGAVDPATQTELGVAGVPTGLDPDGVGEGIMFGTFWNAGGHFWSPIAEKLFDIFYPSTKHREQLAAVPPTTTGYPHVGPAGAEAKGHPLSFPWWEQWWQAAQADPFMREYSKRVRQGPSEFLKRWVGEHEIAATLLTVDRPDVQTWEHWPWKAHVPSGGLQGPPPRIVPLVNTKAARVARALAYANQISGMGQDYVFGGGHGGWDFDGPFDCSGFVSAILHFGLGLLSGPTSTAGLLPGLNGLVGGGGQLITGYTKQTGNPHTSHTFISIGGQQYESGGQRPEPNGAGRTSRSAAGFTPWHPQGYDAGGIVGVDGHRPSVRDVIPILARRGEMIITPDELAAARGRGGGGLTFNFPHYVGDKRELQAAVVDALTEYEKRNGSYAIR